MRFGWLLTGLLAVTIASPSNSAERGEQPSCWRDGGLTLCFDDAGKVSSEVLMTYDENSLEGFETSARYWGTGDVIHFEVLQPEYMNDGWPWAWSRVTCRLGGPEGVMELTECNGSGRSYWPGTPVAQDDITLTLVQSKSEALCDAYEKLLSLPGTFKEVGHATLLDGGEL